MILCAAVKFHIERANEEVVIPCWRHGESFKIMKSLGFKPGEYKDIEQGFITTNNMYLNREDAWNHAVNCGQINKTTIWYKSDHEREPYELFSEDLY